MAECQPQAAYSDYINGLKQKFTFLHTISNLEHYIQPIEEVIPVITSGGICSDNERKLIALPIKFGGFGLLDYCETQKFEY